MSVLIDTRIEDSRYDKTVLSALMYGIISGEFKFYKNLDDNTISIKFENDEDATIFTLRELDKVFYDANGFRLGTTDAYDGGMSKNMTGPGLGLSNADLRAAAMQSRGAKSAGISAKSESILPDMKADEPCEFE